MVFPDKYIKVLKSETGFIDTANSLSENELKKLILSCEANINKVEEAKANDQKLNDAKETVKEYTAPYSETKKLLTAKIKYSLYLLNERGISLTH